MPTSRWIRTYVVIVDAAVLAAAQSRAAQNDWDEDTGGINTFTVPLSANGQAPAAAYGAHTAATASMLTTIQNVIANHPTLKGHMRAYRTDDGSNTWGSALTTLGLQVIAPVGPI